MGPSPLLAAAVALALAAAAQGEQSLYVDLHGQDRLSATGEQLAWSIDEEGILIEGAGISSLKWESWDEFGKWEIYTVGNFTINARQKVNLTPLFNESENVTDTYPLPEGV